MADVDLTHPPRGTWYRTQALDFEAGVSLRSWAALFLVPFTMFWSGLSLGGIYGTQIHKGKFDLTQSLFGIPFLLGTLVLVPATLMTLFGKLAVRGSGDQGAVFVGCGPFGWNRRFRWSEVRGARCTLTKWQQNNRNLPILELTGPKTIRFGSQLSESKRDFLLAAVRQRIGR